MCDRCRARKERPHLLAREMYKLGKNGGYSWHETAQAAQIVLMSMQMQEMGMGNPMELEDEAHTSQQVPNELDTLTPTDVTKQAEGLLRKKGE